MGHISVPIFELKESSKLFTCPPLAEGLFSQWRFWCIIAGPTYLIDPNNTCRMNESGDTLILKHIYINI